MVTSNVKGRVSSSIMVGAFLTTFRLLATPIVFINVWLTKRAISLRYKERLSDFYWRR